MNLPNLFTAIRTHLGPLSQEQVDTVNAILDSCAKHEVTDNRQMCYILGTAMHECGLKPVPESHASRDGRPYNVPDPETGQTYYGRGAVQITFKSNYAQFGRLLDLDLVHHPDLALQTPVAAEIAVLGMRDGRFTGVGLSKYFNDTRTDWVNARKIVNGKDQAEKIGAWAKDLFDNSK